MITRLPESRRAEFFETQLFHRNRSTEAVKVTSFGFQFQLFRRGVVIVNVRRKLFKMVRSPSLSIKEGELGSSAYALTSDDFDLYRQSFELCDREGGGYDWESVAIYLLRSKPRNVANAVTFDSEASLFCALSNKRSALEQLAEMLRHTFRNKQRLMIAIQNAGSFDRKRLARRPKFSAIVAVHFNRYLYYAKEPLIEGLKEGLPKAHPLVYYPGGLGEDTFYIRTNDADDAISAVRPILRDHDLLKSAIIAVAPRDSAEYVIVYPRKRKTPLVPKNELPTETFPYEC